MDTKLGVSWCCGNYCLLAFVLWCGYCSVSFQSFVLRHWCPQHQETTTKLYCYGTHTVGINIKSEMVLLPNDEVGASSKNHTQFKTRVHKPRLQNSPYFLHIQASASSQIKGLERGWKWRVRLRRDANLTCPTGVWGSHASRAEDSYATLYWFLYWFWEKTDCFAV